MQYNNHNLLNAYTPLPISFTKGDGVWLIDEANDRYLDLIAGMGVTILGHTHPEIISTIKAQSNNLLHTSNLVQIPAQAQLATMLANLANLAPEQDLQTSKMFFTNSGAEAVEIAIKLTRLFANVQKIVDPKIIVMHNGYHGRTMAALSASSNPDFKAGFAPLVNSFISIKLNDIAALDYLDPANHHNKLHAKIVAILLEPIQGEGGVNSANYDFMLKIRAMCTKNNWLLILDEIQTGLARTGKMFCYQHYNITPDVLIIAKGLANGIPIGACIIKQPFANLFKPKSHGSTFGGNPLACVTAIKTLEILVTNKLWEKSQALGAYFIHKLQQKLHNYANVLAIRGKGLMIGIELKQGSKELILQGLKQKLLFNITRDKIIRLLPPLIINQAEIDLAVEKLSLILK